MIATQGSYMVETAVESLKSLIDLEIELSFNEPNDTGIDGTLRLNNQTFPIEMKKEFRLNQLLHLTMLQKAYPNLILITESLPDNIKTALRNHKLNYLDTAGNAYIQQGFIFINGQKKLIKLETNKNKAFTKKGIAVVFYFLNDETLLNQTYRQISAITGASLDTITKVIQSLKQQGFIIQKTDKTTILIEKKRLFEKWADAYENRLKPDFFVGRFRFLTIEAERNWRNLELSDNAIWGGEPAADILTNFLSPGIFTLYSTETKGDLMRNYRIAPDPKGNIYVYLPFFTINTEKTLYPLLVYADMLNTGDGRNIEVAQRIYEQYVKNIF